MIREHSGAFFRAIGIEQFASKTAKALWDTNQGAEEKTKHAFKRPPLRDPLIHPLWTRFRFFLGAGLGYSQLVSLEARAFSPLSSPPPIATIKYSFILSSDR
ncbi:hypothetical protein ADS79_31950 [Brevibacillus reuszeri]|uniref:Uncharacterized protein n=1 Tax=Brevibacillus reuszeri TaxID=54915 RepID=A0A0K9YIU4_9BACL|nr:hypothetical protein ADS79_31950 [Brevibacillus reuszeri]